MKTECVLGCGQVIDDTYNARIEHYFYENVCPKYGDWFSTMDSERILKPLAKVVGRKAAEMLMRKIKLNDSVGDLYLFPRFLLSEWVVTAGRAMKREKLSAQEIVDRLNMIANCM